MGTDLIESFFQVNSRKADEYFSRKENDEL